MATVDNRVMGVNATRVDVLFFLFSLEKIPDANHSTAVYMDTVLLSMLL